MLSHTAFCARHSCEVSLCPQQSTARNTLAHMKQFRPKCDHRQAGSRVVRIPRSPNTVRQCAANLWPVCGTVVLMCCCFVHAARRIDENIKQMMMSRATCERSPPITDCLLVIGGSLFSPASRINYGCHRASTQTLSIDHCLRALHLLLLERIFADANTGTMSAS